MIDQNTRQECELFIDRYITPSNTNSLELTHVITSACRVTSWVRSKALKEAFKRALKKRYGLTTTMLNGRSVYRVEYTAVYYDARKWSMKNGKSILEYEGAQQPALIPAPDTARREPVVTPQSTISTEQVAKKLRAMSNTLAIFSQSLERLMEEREHNSMQLLDACREFASDQRMLRDLVDSMLPGGDNATTD